MEMAKLSRQGPQGARGRACLAVTAATDGVPRDLGHARSVPGKLELITSDYLFFGILVTDNVTDASNDNLY